MYRQPFPYRHRLLAQPRRGRTSLHGAFLLYQLLDRLFDGNPKPPVTLFLIALNLVLFYLPTLRPFLPLPLRPLYNTLQPLLTPAAACLQPRAILHGARFRLLLSSFIHLNDLHLLYNMTSFLYKALILETSLGSPFFLALVLYLSFFAHSLYVLIAYLAHHLAITSALMNRCVVGFSGVVFGLKVVINSHPRYSQHATQLFGFSLPSGLAPWAELFLASAIMPNVSFLGHLTGILAGLAFVYVPKFVAHLLPNHGSFRFGLARPNSWTPFQGRGRYARVHDD